MPYGRGDIEQLSGLEKELTDISQETIDAIVKSLNSVDRVVTGSLAQSVDAIIEVNGNVFSFTIIADGYWKFVDKGVDGYERSVGSEFKYKKNGKAIPVDAMKSFLKNRGITPSMSISAHKKSETFKDKRIKSRAKKLNKENAFKSLAYAMGVSIKKKGVKPTHFMSNVLTPAWKDIFVQRVQKALGKDINIFFEDIKESIEGR